MGNEMGNNNSSGLQEEENRSTRDQGRPLQEAGQGDGTEVGNHIVPVRECKDNHGKETGLDSDAPKKEGDSPIVNQIFYEKEKVDIEVHHPDNDKSPETEIKSNDEVGDGTGKIQPISPSEDSNKKLLQSSLEENMSQMNDLELEKQTLIKKEDEEINRSNFDTKSSSNDSELPGMVESTSDQPDKLAEIQANVSLQDSNGSPLETEDILGSNLTCISEENGHLIGDNIREDEGEISVSVSSVTEEVEIRRDDLRVKEMTYKKEEMSCEEKLETEGDCNDIGQKSMMTSECSSGVEIKCNGDFPAEINPIRSDSPEAELEAISMDKSPTSHLEVSEYIDNCVAFTAGTISLHKESEHGENRPDPCPAQSCEESVKGSEVDNANVSQSDLVTMEPKCERSDKGAADYTSAESGSNTDCTEEANVSPSALVMIGPEAVNNEKRAVDYVFSIPGINEDSIEEGNVSESEVVVIKPEPVNEGKKAADYASSYPGINKDSMEEPNVPQSELVMIEPQPVNNEKSTTDYASNDPGTNKDSIQEANVSQFELVDSETEVVNDTERATGYAFCDPVINKDGTEANVSQSELVMFEPVTENSGPRSAFRDSGIKDCIEDATVAENGHLIDVVNDQNKACSEQHNDSTEEAVMVPESGVFLAESSLMPCIEALKEKKIVEEIESKNEAPHVTENIAKVTESGNHCMPPTLAEQTEAFLPRSSPSLNQPQDNQQNNERESEKIESSNEPISELKQENCGEFLVTEVSSFVYAELMSETLLSVVELAMEKSGQDASEYTIKPAVTVAESNTPADNFSGQCAKDHETPAFASELYQAQESVERHSTESNPSNSNIQAQMQKSPSFGLDLRIEARSEESDRISFLYQDKTAIEDFSTQAYISLGNSIEHPQTGQATLEYQAMPVEEKVVWMERSDSEKSKIPFLGFLKEEEEAHILITPQKQDNNTSSTKGNKEVLKLPTKEVISTSPKSKEKRKARSSLFTNCMCCTTVMN